MGELLPENMWKPFRGGKIFFGEKISPNFFLGGPQKKCPSKLPPRPLGGFSVKSLGIGVFL